MAKLILLYPDVTYESLKDFWLLTVITIKKNLLLDIRKMYIIRTGRGFMLKYRASESILCNKKE